MKHPVEDMASSVVTHHPPKARGVHIARSEAREQIRGEDDRHQIGHN